MDELIYNALENYYSTLSKLGYLSDSQTYKLLVLSFYRDFMFNDYRGFLTEEDYKKIEEALDCIYGTTCLIPYPDYLDIRTKNHSSGSGININTFGLRFGTITEIAQRTRNLEDTNVLKLVKDTPDTVVDPESDIVFVPATESQT